MRESLTRSPSLRPAAVGGVRSLTGRLAKRLLDLAVAMACLIVVSPLLLTVAVAIRLTTPGPALFDSGTSGISPGGSFTTTLGSGGTYAYFCRFHPSTMRGRLQLPDKVSPATGSAGTTFTLTVATANAL